LGVGGERFGFLFAIYQRLTLAFPSRITYQHVLGRDIQRD
jgi:hypothetical protein